MSKSNDKRSIMKLPVDHPLYRQANWVTEEVNYNQCSYQQLEDENHHILVTLKLIESRLSQELKQKKLSNLVQVHPKPPENLKALQQKIKNNQKYIQVLKRDIDQAEARKVALNQGLESKTLDIKLSLERRIQMLKQELKKMKLEEHDTEKRLVAHGGQMNKPEYVEEHKRMEEELRCLSVKYVRLLDKYNKSVEQLAILSNIDIDQIEIPEHIYDNQLQERQQVQYKEYQGIVKLCKVLSHRNDSEHNKAHREYTLKLKELEKVIMNLGQLDHSITTKEGEIIESRKNIELMKIKYQNGESGRQQLKLSQASMPRTKSYSSANLPHSQRIKGRGSSFVKLPKSIHS